MPSRIASVLLLLLVLPLLAYAQVTLTGAAWFSATPTGATSVSQAYADGFLNTMGGDQWWNLWIALHANATSPVNGPSDDQAPISIPLEAGNSYQYHIFGAEFCCMLPFSGLSLFFDGNSSSAGISVYGPLNRYSFVPDNSSILSLAGDPAPGSGTGFYSSAGVVAVLAEFNWNASATPPGDVAQPFLFAPDPDGQAGPFGSFTVRVWNAASLSLGESSGAPGTPLTLTGSGFDPSETVIVYGGHIGAPPIIATVTTDATGSFTAAARIPRHPFGPTDVYALGATSQKLGAASISITPALIVSPDAVDPGGTTTAQMAGFGAGEIIDIYWKEPRQFLGTTSANAGGSAGIVITVPPDAPGGHNAVIAVGQTTKAIAISHVAACCPY